MANKNYSRKTSEEKQAEIEELSAKALSQIERYTKSPEALLEYANFMSQFHYYSPRNQLLIQNQFEGAQAVASFKDWAEKGYKIQKGEKGIEILSYTPITFFKNEKGEQKQLRYATSKEKELIKAGVLEARKVSAYKKGHVFDVSQTNAKPEDLPEIFPNRQYNFKIDKETIPYLKKGIEEVSKSIGIQIKDMKESRLGINELGSAKGAYVEDITGKVKEIVMNSRNTETQNLATSIHELAHAKLHNRSSGGKEIDSATKEFQAELTSYVVCKHYGMDTSEKAIPYIAAWTDNGQKLQDKQRTMEGVHSAAKEFIEIIDHTIMLERENSLSRNNEKENNYDKKLTSDHKLSGLSSVSDLDSKKRAYLANQLVER